jgi:HAD superfamily hydrolase (TIGR01509 family)
MHAQPLTDAVVLDCYGTLVEVTEPKDVPRRIAALVGRRMDPSPMTTDRPLIDMVREAAPHASRNEIMQLRADLRTEIDSVRPLPGAQAAVDRLRAAGHLVCLASNLARDYAPPVMRIMGADYRFLSFEMGLAKPDPRFFAEVLRKLRTEPSRTVMVGDSMRSDVLGAQAAGMRTVLVSRTGRDGVTTAPDIVAAEALPELRRPRLSEVIGRHIALEPDGAEFHGECPIHPDGQKAFYVSDVNGIYHCYACGVHGREPNFRTYVLPYVDGTVHPDE